VGGRGRLDALRKGGTVSIHPRIVALFVVLALVVALAALLGESTVAILD